MCERNVTIYFSKHNGILSKWQTFGFDSTWPCCCLNGIFPCYRVLSLAGSSRNPIWSVHGFKRERLSLWWVALRFLRYQTKNTFDSIDKCLLVEEFLLCKIVSIWYHSSYTVVPSLIPILQQAKWLCRLQSTYYKVFLKPYLWWALRY
jgi:hypothetical protein